MPSRIVEEIPSKKRKRLTVEDHDVKLIQRTKSAKSVAKQHAAQVTELEDAISASQKNLNNIATLLALAKKDVKLGQSQSAATIALCRVFCRLHVDSRLTRSTASSEKELAIIEWLRARYADYQGLLLDRITKGDLTSQVSAVNLCMHLLQEEVSNATKGAESIWKNGLFLRIVDKILSVTSGEDLCQEFVKTYVQQYDDVRHYTFSAITSLLKTADRGGDFITAYTTNALTILFTLTPLDQTATKLKSLLCSHSTTNKPLTLSTHRKAAQTAWLSLLSSPLSKVQRKTILTHLTTLLLPWFPSPTHLMDFLTDSFNPRGATSLLALSGLFHLITTQNLDYPDFYRKLYSLLDGDLLHSKHRSRFFRLLNTFMSSTHLPAALVASFIKRLSRLALSAPPAAVVAIVPWVYNMLQTHPTCTFMLHRVPRTSAEIELLETEGAKDPFNMQQEDPNETGAIDSCLWELVTLQKHYHPNVASLAGIMGEQFTKRNYQLEDFLDYSYGSLIDAELDKELKKAPVIEFVIPKQIFTTPEGNNWLEKLMEDVLASS